ncbi:MAG TPA: hypothetical protein VMS29_10550 [Pyrinomonadaceae bacterium]|nr:hypothetical protein [Pyrinomonadaceae bacterium]
MTRFLLLFILALGGICYSQTDKAIATYSVNDKLVGLSNLANGLSDCSIRSTAGKVKRVELLEDRITVTLKISKNLSESVFIPLDRVADEDRKPIFKHLITKNNVIRVSGYACDPDAPFPAFSVDRVY